MEKLVQSTNVKIRRERDTLKYAEKILARYGDISITEIRCYLGLLMFQRNTKICVEKLWYGENTHPFYKAAMSLNRYKFLLKCVAFHNHESILDEYCWDLFARSWWLLEKFKNIARSS